MAEITMCSGLECPKKETCHRFNAKASEYRQSFFVTPPYDKEKDKCNHYWRDEDKNDPKTN